MQESSSRDKDPAPAVEPAAGLATARGMKKVSATESVEEEIHSGEGIVNFFSTPCYYCLNICLLTVVLLKLNIVCFSVTGGDGDGIQSFNERMSCVLVMPQLIGPVAVDAFMVRQTVIKKSPPMEEGPRMN